MTEHQRRIARARLLRRQGKTYAEIRAVVGDVSDDRLATWLAGIPRPPETFRGRARSDVRDESRRLRALGHTYAEIAELTGASKGSISLWVRDVTMTHDARDRHLVRLRDARAAAGRGSSRRADSRRDAVRAAAQRELGIRSARDLFVAGVALYWAEGSKSKPWRRQSRVVFINSDLSVVRLFLDWLDLVGVDESDRSYRLNIHESADVSTQQAWWACQLRLPLASFSRPTLKRHNPRPVRRNCAEDYHGCLVVTVARSSALYYAIEGWWARLSAPNILELTESNRIPP